MDSLDISGTTAPTGTLDALTERAATLDELNALAHTRDRFLIPPGTVYLDGNSLGALPAAVPAALDDAVRRQWGRGLISSWFDEGWWDAPPRIGDRIGALIGAAPGQVVAGDSTSVQLFNTLTAAARLRGGRRVLLTDPGHFPTDAYLTDSVAELLDLEVRRVPAPGVPAALAEYGDRVGVLSYPIVDYRTGELWDLPGLTRAAHDVGAVTVWDLCHGAGAIPIGLDESEVDFAVGCTYKYLSGGPGSPAYAYIAARHHGDVRHPLTGWHGHADPFAMQDSYTPAEGIARARVGCPPLLSLLALEAALTAFDGVELADVRATSLSLTGFFIECCDALLADRDVRVGTPREPEHRGSQVAVRHRDAVGLVPELALRSVLCDKREPDILRFGFNALYNTHADALTAIRVLRDLTE
ncbi:MAG TPA: aminotransferase class V-fold PLP-dependent enzyme [Actinocrinis sp.]|uniref:kynureninase n=1 Tax=Actinocrinis sp. TaxID=1920516 RepID=UPI002DDDA227|nr:aminotransferase class V-fold PLP-dependent enzyme [Actinocrinis sp.]HEV2347524.1 aminotransferase class V-fold PLP-dependent enzyme [Actinocrinis sp.]